MFMSCSGHAALQWGSRNPKPCFLERGQVHLLMGIFAFLTGCLKKSFR
ncbi:hypothetical protein M5D96_000118 [Drosophila gunungcola]|uniref:Uncharacterized protein n=1 Tax=Drosophila gunungcola TaxID=103775 RepID=A0A9Q0BU33_9MUSC|nr:hypothetical protein M5D96_000118 [Drosophila gunungcola]